MTRRPLILAVLVLAVTMFAAAGWYTTRPAPTADATPVASETVNALVRSYTPILGPEDAPVTVVEFFDPACESCRAFYPIVKDIMAEHGEAVRVAIRYAPFHGDVSELAIRALEAARMQGVYAPVLEALLREQGRWAAHGATEPDLILKIAATAGLDVEAARTQMLAPDLAAILNQDRADIETLGVRGTPTFFVNGKALERFGEAELRELVAAEVAAATR